MINKLDMNAMVRWNAADHSRLFWVEARYRWGSADFGVQWQRNSGSPGSEYGASPQRRSWQALMRYYF